MRGMKYFCGLLQLRRLGCCPSGSESRSTRRLQIHALQSSFALSLSLLKSSRRLLGGLSNSPSPRALMGLEPGSEPVPALQAHPWDSHQLVRPAAARERPACQLPAEGPVRKQLLPNLLLLA